MVGTKGITRLMIYTLAHRVSPRRFYRRAAFWQAMAEASPELVLLDIMLPARTDQHLKKLRPIPHRAIP